jgi:hypothetical protein
LRCLAFDELTPTTAGELPIVSQSADTFETTNTIGLNKDTQPDNHVAASEMEMPPEENNDGRVHAKHNGAANIKKHKKKNSKVATFKLTAQSVHNRLRNIVVDNLKTDIKAGVTKKANPVDDGFRVGIGAEERGAKEGGYFLQGVVSVDVGIHRTSVSGEKTSSGGVRSERLELTFNVDGAFLVRRKFLTDRLQLLIHPAAKAMSETTSNRDNGAGFPGFLVHLCSDVEIWEGVINFNGAVEVDEVVLGQGFSKVDKKLIDELVGSANCDLSQVVIFLFIGCSVAEVVGKYPANIYLVLNDAWAELLWEGRIMKSWLSCNCCRR